MSSIWQGHSKRGKKAGRCHWGHNKSVIAGFIAPMCAQHPPGHTRANAGLCRIEPCFQFPAPGWFCVHQSEQDGEVGAILPCSPASKLPSPLCKPSGQSN